MPDSFDHFPWPATTGLRREGRAAGTSESAATGVVQAFLLACGYLFMVLCKGLLEGPQALLFGSFLGITSGQVLTLAAVGAFVLATMAAIGRPLLFATVDPAVAAARTMIPLCDKKSGVGGGT